MEGFKRLLSLPDNAHDKAILALIGWHGLRVEEVANLDLSNLALEGELPTLTVTGKGSKIRKVHLIERSAAALGAWLDIRQAQPGERAVFVSIGNRVKGERLTTRAVRYMVDSYLGQAGLTNKSDRKKLLANEKSFNEAWKEYWTEASRILDEVYRQAIESDKLTLFELYRSVEKWNRMKSRMENRMDLLR